MKGLGKSKSKVGHANHALPESNDQLKNNFRILGGGSDILVEQKSTKKTKGRSLVLSVFSAASRSM
jgi:hypothetical protein